MEKECIEGVFYYACEKDSTYSVIEDGAWLNDKPYAVVHRIAIAEGTRGIGSFCLNWALEQAGNVRIDTHIDNKPMQELLKKLGFPIAEKSVWMMEAPELHFRDVKMR